MFQVRLAYEWGRLDHVVVRQAEYLAARLADLIPEQPASIIHGDLWSGNVMTNSKGDPAIIDPAAYFGWAEADLAMTSLFGGFPPVFYQAYQEFRPLQPGWRERFPLYNLYHLLNHLNLFGASYREPVMGILENYSPA
jgi:fructosamine-3-kinase